jgi:antitoxin VapB
MAFSTWQQFEPIGPDKWPADSLVGAEVSSYNELGGYAMRMTMATVVTDADGQIVRLPASVHLDGDEVLVQQVGQSVVLSPKQENPWQPLIDSLDVFTDDFVQERNQPRDQLPKYAAPVEGQDDWEQRLFDAALDCGVSVPDSALSSEGLYE